MTAPKTAPEICALMDVGIYDSLSGAVVLVGDHLQDFQWLCDLLKPAGGASIESVFVVQEFVLGEPDSPWPYMFCDIIWTSNYPNRRTAELLEQAPTDKLSWIAEGLRQYVAEQAESTWLGKKEGVILAFIEQTLRERTEKAP